MVGQSNRVKRGMDNSNGYAILYKEKHRFFPLLVVKILEINNKNSILQTSSNRKRMYLVMFYTSIKTHMKLSDKPNN